ncbi:MAG: sigma-70 family RNA polymerase sigma factor [Bacillota bacterium]
MIEFVDKAKQGSEKAFMILVEDMKAQMYKTAYVRLRNEQDALDAVQEAFIKAFSSIKSLRENRFFKTWLIRILLNECHNIQQYKRKVIPMENNLVEQKYTSEQDSIETMDIHSVLNQLDDIYKEVIDLRYNHDLKFEDIARVLDIPLGTVKSRLNRAHSLLRNQLRDEYCEKEVLS